MKILNMAMRATAFVLAFSSVSALAAENYPSRTVRIIVPFGVSGLDTVARAFAERLTAQTGVGFVVENREGAGGAIGTTYAAAAAPDGYSILMTAHPSFAMFPYLKLKPPYDPIRDFVPIARVSTTPLVLIASNTAPFTNFNEMVAYARQNPDKLNYAGSGIGTASHLFMEQIKMALSLRITFIPYSTSGQQMTDTIGGQVQMSLPAAVAGLPQAAAGKVRLLAVGSGKRNPNYPNVPTFAEGMGQPGYEGTVWYGFLGPRGMPAAFAEKLNSELAKAMVSPQITKVMQGAGLEPAFTTTAEFATVIEQSAAASRGVIRDLKIQPD